jgi:hypothetical protein
MYTALYMSIRTQIYLTREQRARLDALVRREKKSLAQLIREAIDAYLSDGSADPREALAATFGSMPDLVIPSRDEWDRG